MKKKGNRLPCAKCGTWTWFWEWWERYDFYNCEIRHTPYCIVCSEREKARLGLVGRA
jgi:hypothetical protein